MRCHAWPWLVLAVATPACRGDVATDTRTQAIIGGEIATPAEFPTIVGLEYGPGDWTCTGTLVHPQWVLTAAHCVAGETAASLQVRFDDADINDAGGGIVVELAAIHAHPAFDDNVWDNDIAVLELAEPMTDRLPTPVHRAPIAPATTVTQVGYGDSDDSGGGAGILRKLVTANIACADAHDPELSDANLLCFAAGDGTATCYGDSGGPTYVAGAAGLEVVGVNSGGTQDLCDAGYDLQTSVPGELDFVDQFVPDEPPGDDVPPGDDEPPGDDDGGGGGCAATGGDGTGNGLALLAIGLGLAVNSVSRRRARLCSGSPACRAAAAP